MNNKKNEVINTINRTKEVDFNFKDQSNLSQLYIYLYQAFENINNKVNQEDINNTYLNCHERAFQDIIHELKENYRKYGTEGKLTIHTEDNQLIITLHNKKKEKSPEDFSSGL